MSAMIDTLRRVFGNEVGTSPRDRAQNQRTRILEQLSEQQSARNTHERIREAQQRSAAYDLSQVMESIRPTGEPLRVAIDGEWDDDRRITIEEDPNNTGYIRPETGDSMESLMRTMSGTINALLDRVTQLEEERDEYFSVRAEQELGL